jgi:hypothetical protein
MQPTAQLGRVIAVREDLEQVLAATPDPLNRRYHEVRESKVRELEAERDALRNELRAANIAVDSQKDSIALAHKLAYTCFVAFVVTAMVAVGAVCIATVRYAP